jgi:outer membrane lipopolysaccharide assembly protein LptE/RlpB
MNHKLKTTIVAFALVGGLAACDSKPRDTASAPNPNNDRATARNNDTGSARNSGGIAEPNRTSQGMNGSELEDAVKAKLQSDEQLRSASIRVSADAEKNAVTLSGTVPSEEARNKALELAKSAHSGLTINDKIEVKPVA